ncbi:MAG: AAA family ATPase [Armatimonadetes bacterium]|nr:AAA family ATPase [Armatimonadota bacterium]
MIPLDQLSSRWIIDFEKQTVRGKHILLYGNVHDQFLWRGNYITATDFLTSFFVDKRADIVLRYDPMDGFKFATPDMEKVFEELRSKRFAEMNPGLSGQDGSVPAQVVPSADDPAAAPPRRAPGAVIGNVTQRIPAEDAFSRLRLVLAQQDTSVVAVVDLADMLTSDPSRYTEPERNTLMLLKKCTLEASMVRQGALAGYRNTVVITAGELKRVPEWFYRDNPFVSIVQCARPNRDERQQFAMAFVRPAGNSRGFFGGEEVTAQQPEQPENSGLAGLAEEFADLTDGFQAWDLEALRRTSWAERISVKEPRKLIDFFKFGLRDDPWEKLNSEKVRDATDILTKRVIGQPRAVEAVTTMLTGARVGLSMTGGGGIGGRPKGVFFFVGPTGVGKTELAKAVTELVFGDEKAFARFDMSEYKEEHAAEKLAGAPPGFVGYEEGGQLTNRVMEHPHSILLFDEIEKAHPKVLDKFLQILEDGRLTDGKGQTAYFNQTAIIFTSNIGSSDLTDPTTGNVIREGIMRRVSLDNVGDFPYEDIARHFRNEVDWYFTSRIGRAELLNRLGDNVVVFDILRPEHVSGIGRKFLSLLAANAQEKYHLTINFQDSILDHLGACMREGDNLLYGGRRVKTVLEGCVERPLNRWVFENVSDPKSMAGATITLEINEGVLEVNRV